MRHAALQSPNFGFLAAHHPHLLEYAARAERYVLDDPNTTLIKLRQLAEELAELAAAYTKLPIEEGDGFSDILHALKRKRYITQEMADIFHGLRKTGNAAAHEGAGTRHQAIAQLKLAYKLAVWFHQAFRNPDFRPRPFVLPPNPHQVSPALKEELNRLRRERWESEREADESEDALRMAIARREVAERKAATVYAELEAALALAEESEAQRNALVEEHRARVTELQAQAAKESEGDLAQRGEQARIAATRFDLTEGEARERIDAQLRARGWESDSIVRTWEKGARPQPGRSMAIAFCPVGKGHADYVLYCGQTVVGIIEAKRRNIDLCAALEEALDYSGEYTQLSDERLPANEVRVPLLFASNGRPFAGEDDIMHGVWFRDNRNPDVNPYALEAWPTPAEVAAQLNLTMIQA